MLKRRMGEDGMNAEALIDAIKSVVWYNGFGEAIDEWIKLEPVRGNQIRCPLLDANENSTEYWQLQMLWMLCVVLFGDYGTSPRFGWIEDVKGFREFLKRIRTEEYCECEMDMEIVINTDMIREVRNLTIDKVELAYGKALESTLAEIGVMPNAFLTLTARFTKSLEDMRTEMELFT